MALAAVEDLRLETASADPHDGVSISTALTAVEGHRAYANFLKHQTSKRMGASSHGREYEESPSFGTGAKNATPDFDSGE